MAKVETVRTGKLGKTELRLAKRDQQFFGLVNGSICVEGDNADEVWKRLHGEAGKANPKYFGYDGARSRFLKFFPNGFHSPGYAGQERDYKISAKQKLDSTAPLSEAIKSSGLGEAVLAVFRATNMLSPFEKTRLQDMLRGPSADHFIQAAARFAINSDKAGLADMERILKPHDCAKWTIVTYLPFLWNPEAHMFLKPETTKDFAVRVGHSFASDYEAGLKIAVYDKLLNLVQETTAKLVDLKPRDQVDIQSFIWTVGNYKDDSEGVYL